MPTDLFNRIAARYDRVNRFLSLGLDRRWRRIMADHLPDKGGLHVLDLSTGTGAVAIVMAADPRVVTVVGVDLSEDMLQLARLNVANLTKIKIVRGDALALDYPEKTFDVVSIGFGVRNFDDLMKGLMEAHRVLKPGGKIIILEFSRPSISMVRACHSLYLKYVVPAIGGLFSGSAKAYNYLVRTALAFPYAQRFLRILGQVGFSAQQQQPLTLGAVTIYTAVRVQE